MQFSEAFESLISSPSHRIQRFAQELNELHENQLEEWIFQSQRITQKHFGKTIHLFAPLYLSNECINNCQYCGFSRDNPILRTTLTIKQVVQEAQYLHSQGFRHLLLVTGEHPKFVSNGYLTECIKALQPFIPSISLEVGPTETTAYETLVQTGAEGLVVYQETYHQKKYEQLHTAGPKKNFRWRLDCPQRAYEAGFRRLGIGALLGLSDWKQEALYLAIHLDYLYRQCWKAEISVSFPRLRPHCGEETFRPNPHEIPNSLQLTQLILLFRRHFPTVGITLSTREPANLRDLLIPAGITHMSAGSTTNPGGYTGIGQDNLHFTHKGKRIELTAQQEKQNLTSSGQFEIDDERSPQYIAEVISKQGYEPVWKNWEPAILNS